MSLHPLPSQTPETFFAWVVNNIRNVAAATFARVAM